MRPFLGGAGYLSVRTLLAMGVLGRAYGLPMTPCSVKSSAIPIQSRLMSHIVVG